MNSREQGLLSMRPTAVHLARIERPFAFCPKGIRANINASIGEVAECGCPAGGERCVSVVSRRRGGMSQQPLPDLRAAAGSVVTDDHLCKRETVRPSPL